MRSPRLISIQPRPPARRAANASVSCLRGLRDRRNLQSLGVKHGTLLDVELEKSNGILIRLCSLKPIWIKSECANRFFERKTLCVFETQQRRIKTPGNR